MKSKTSKTVLRGAITLLVIISVRSAYLGGYHRGSIDALDRNSIAVMDTIHRNVNLGSRAGSGSRQLQVIQGHWQQPRPFPLNGIEWAERINEQMMRQRYRHALQRLEELR